MSAAVLAVLQVTDLHLMASAAGTLRRMDTAASFEAVLTAALAERRPDALLVTGDIAQEPVTATYQRARAIIDRHYDGPVLCVPGNHDVLDGMCAAGLALDPIDLEGWQLYGLDTHEDDTVNARLTDDARTALGSWLDRARVNLLVATHHPLVDVGCPWLDQHRLRNAHEVLEILAAHNRRTATARVRAVVFGHVHQEFEGAHEGIGLYGAPSTCFQFAPHTVSFGIDPKPPGCRWLMLNRDGTVTSRVQRVTLEPAIEGGAP